MKIAVLMNDGGRTAGFSEDAALYVFERIGDAWAANAKYDWSPRRFASMRALRAELVELVRWLDDCKVVAARRRSNGFYRVVLEGCGIALWAMEGRPQEYIAQIEKFHALCEQPAKAAETPELIRPIAGKAGHYAVDLREVMAHHLSVNSRDVLMPFFQNATFERLEITCDHVPKWFGKELPKLMLRADTELQKTAMKVHVYSIAIANG